MSTPSGKQIAKGLPALAKIGFQVSISDIKHGQKAWSETVQFLVQ